MSDPIMELVDAHARALHRYYTDASNERAEQEAKGGRAAIEHEVAALRERAERAERERDACKLEAQIHAQEARTANASLAKCYQAVTGNAGEPGNWHGANPIKQRIAALEAESATNAGRVDSLKAAIELLNGSVELFKADVKRLEAENAALMEDAERYRWFRTHENWRDGGPFDSYYGADLDAAVDEARIQIP